MALHGIIVYYDTVTLVSTATAQTDKLQSAINDIFNYLAQFLASPHHLWFNMEPSNLNN